VMTVVMMAVAGGDLQTCASCRPCLQVNNNAVRVVHATRCAYGVMLCMYVCIMLYHGCRSLHVAYSGKKLIQLSAVAEAAYSQALRICRDMLQLKFGEVTLDRLAVMFDGEHIRRDAYAVLNMYKVSDV